MKKIGIILAIFSIILSCNPKPECEVEYWGDVIVENQTGYSIWTDVTFNDVDINHEEYLRDRTSYRYMYVPSGSIEIWLSYDGNDWVWEYENLSACEELTFTWYSTNKKSGSFILKLPNGLLVEPNVKEK